MRRITYSELFAAQTGYTLVPGDCIELMNDLPEGCVDLVFGSPPYEDARSYGEVGFKMKGQDWVDWMVEVFRAAVRISRGLVAMVVGHGKTKGYRWSATPTLLMADLHRAGFWLRAPTLYERVGISGSGGKDYFRYDYEWIVTAQNPKYALQKGRSVGRLPWANPVACGHRPKWAPGGSMSHRMTDGTRRSQWGTSGSGGGNRRNGGNDDRQVKRRPSHQFQINTHKRADGEAEPQVYMPPAVSNPGAVIQRSYTSEEVEAIIGELEAGDVAHCTVGGGQMGHKLAHENEAPFPLALPERFVLSFVPPAGIVCDPFNGSGSTGHAAVENGRRYLGFDARPCQIKLTNERLQTVTPKLIVEADEAYKLRTGSKERAKGERQQLVAEAKAQLRDHPAACAQAGLFDGLPDPDAA